MRGRLYNKFHLGPSTFLFRHSTTFSRSPHVNGRPPTSINHWLNYFCLFFLLFQLGQNSWHQENVVAVLLHRRLLSLHRDSVIFGRCCSLYPLTRCCRALLTHIFLESTKNPREFLDSFWIQFIWEQIRFHVDFSIFPFGKFLPRWIIRVHQDLLLPWWIIFSPECVCVCFYGWDISK